MQLLTQSLESNNCKAFDYDEYYLDELPTKKKLKEVHCNSSQLHAVKIRDAVLNQVKADHTILSKFVPSSLYLKHYLNQKSKYKTLNAMDHSPIRQTFKLENDFSTVRKSFLNLVKM